MNYSRHFMDAGELPGVAGLDMVELAVRSSTAKFLQHMTAAGLAHPTRDQRLDGHLSATLTMIVLNGQLMCFELC